MSAQRLGTVLVLVGCTGCYTLLFGGSTSTSSAAAAASSSSSGAASLSTSSSATSLASSSAAASSSSAAQSSSSSLSSSSSSSSSSSDASASSSASSAAASSSSAAASSSGGLAGDTCFNAIEVSPPTTLTEQTLSEFVHDYTVLGVWTTNCQAAPLQYQDRVYKVHVPTSMNLHVEVTPSVALDPAIFALAGPPNECANVQTNLRGCHDTYSAGTLEPITVTDVADTDVYVVIASAADVTTPETFAITFSFEP